MLFNMRFVIYLVFVGLLSSMALARNIPLNINSFEFNSDDREKKEDSAVRLILKEQRLRVGECVHLKADIGADFSTATFGIVIGDYSVAFGDVEDISISLREASGTLVKSQPYYFITHAPAGLLELKVWYEREALFWSIKVSGLHYSGSYPFHSNGQPLPFGLLLGAAKKSGYTIESLEVTASSIEYASAPEIHPFFAHKPAVLYKYEGAVPSARHLVLDSIRGPLTQGSIHRMKHYRRWLSGRSRERGEIDGMEHYLLEFPTPTHNYRNYHFRRRFMPYLYEWTYYRTGNRALIDKLIDDSRSVLAHRNDRFGQYRLIYRDAGPLWPHFRGLIREHDGSMTMWAGSASISAFTWLTVTARVISDNPELWERHYGERTYREIAEEMIAAALESVDYYYEQFLDETDNLLKYSDAFPRTEWHGNLLIWNRCLPFVSGTIPLAEALENFEQQPERVLQMDRVNRAMIDRFFSHNVIYYEKDNTIYMRYPYSEFAQKRNKNHIEDLAHGSFDSRDFQRIYRSGRYEFEEKFIRAFADTYADLVCVEPGTYTARLDGNRNKLKINYDYLSGMVGTIWYAEWRPDLYEKHIDHLINNRLAGQPDAYTYWELFKLKETNENTK